MDCLILDYPALRPHWSRCKRPYADRQLDGDSSLLPLTSVITAELPGRPDGVAVRCGHVDPVSPQRLAATWRCFGEKVAAWPAALSPSFLSGDSARIVGVDAVTLNQRRAAAGGFPKCLTICAKGSLRRAMSFQSNNGPGNPSMSWARPSGSGSR